MPDMLTDCFIQKEKDEEFRESGGEQTQTSSVQLGFNTLKVRDCPRRTLQCVMLRCKKAFRRVLGFGGEFEDD